MSDTNKTVLLTANAAVRAGDHEGFLACCTDDLVWSTVGGETLHGKAAVRAWMRTAYAEPPQFTVDELIAEADRLVAIGEITAPDAQGKPTRHAYCDVWHLRGGKLAVLQAYVVPTPEG